MLVLLLERIFGWHSGPGVLRARIIWQCHECGRVERTVVEDLGLRPRPAGRGSPRSRSAGRIIHRASDPIPVFPPLFAGDQVGAYALSEGPPFPRRISRGPCSQPHCRPDNAGRKRNGGGSGGSDLRHRGRSHRRPWWFATAGIGTCSSGPPVWNGSCAYLRESGQRFGEVEQNGSCLTFAILRHDQLDAAAVVEGVEE